MPTASRNRVGQPREVLETLSLIRHANRGLRRTGSGQAAYASSVNARPRPNPATVEVLLDTTWRIAGAEATRTDALDRKAATLATFASLLASLTAALGTRFVERIDTGWAFALFVGGLAALVGSVAFAVWALFPREYLTLGMAYLRRFPTWSEILKPPEQVRGDAMRGLIEAIARERNANEDKARAVKRAFALLAVGLLAIAVEATTLAAREVW